MERTKSRGISILLSLLAVLLIAFILLIPKLRAMLANAERMERESQAILANAGRDGEHRARAASAREEALRRPGDPQAQLMAARALLQAGSAEQALPFAQAASVLDSRNPACWLILADLRRRARQLYEGMEAYKTALRLDPDNGPALAGLASLYISFGWTADVFELLEPQVKKRPGDLPLKVTLAMAALQADDFARAEKLLLEVRAAAPDEARPWSPLVNLYNTQKQFADAERVAEEVLAKLPNESAVRNELGISLLRQNRVEKAIAAFRYVLVQEPSNISARYYLGLCHQRAGDKQATLQELEKVYTEAPGFEQTCMILGKLYLQNGRTEEGRRLLEEAKKAQARGQRRGRLGLHVATKPKSPDAHFQLAQLYNEESEPHRAIVELHKTIELDSNHVAARKLLKSIESAGPAIGQSAGSPGPPPPGSP